MHYIMGKGNMSVIVSKPTEVRKLRENGFKLQGTAYSYAHAKQKVIQAIKQAGYKQLTEVSESVVTHEVNDL